MPHLEFSRQLLPFSVGEALASASIPLALAEAVEQGRIRRGDRLFLVGTGAGLTIGAVTLVY